jgi:hypothetical protein
MTQAYPPPPVGISVFACVVLKGGSVEARLEGEVLQSSSTATIINLSALSDEARVALARMGLSEADPEGLLAGAPPVDQADASKAIPLLQKLKQDVSLRNIKSVLLHDVTRAPGAAPSGGAFRPISQGTSKPTASTERVQPPSGEFEWAYHLSGPALRAREGELPESTRKGEVGESSWRDSLISFFMDGLTGVVVIHGFREDRWLFLVEGQPVHYALQKTHPGESIGDSIVASERLSREAWDAALERGDSELGVAERLVSEGIFSRAVLHEALRRRTATVTRTLVRANFGDWSFRPVQSMSGRLSWGRVDVLEVLLDAERRNIANRSDEEIVRDTESVLSHHVTVLDGRAAVLSALPLAAAERVVADDLLPGGWTIKELFVYSGLEEQDLLRFLLVLKSLGTLTFLESEGSKTKRNRAERALYVGLRDITRRAEFEALHCHWTAIDEDVERGYQKVLGEFNRARFEAVYDDRIESLIGGIEDRAKELYSQLKTKAGRDIVRKKLVGASQLIMAAVLMGEQGNMAAYKGRLDLARVRYLRVLELAIRGPECAEAVRTAKAQLALDPIRNATSSAGVYFADVIGAVDKFLRES